MASGGGGGGGGGKRGGGGGGGGYFMEERRWRPWVVPAIVVASVAVFVVEMYVNNCRGRPNPFGSCVAGFLRRFAFQPLRQNPLLGPSSSTNHMTGRRRNLFMSLMLRVDG